MKILTSHNHLMLFIYLFRSIGEDLTHRKTEHAYFATDRIAKLNLVKVIDKKTGIIYEITQEAITIAQALYCLSLNNF